MSYARAMKMLEEHRNKYYEQEHELRNNAITRNLNFNPKAALGLGLLTAGSKATMAGSMGAPDDSLLAALGPAAGYAVAGALPLRMMTQRRAQNKAQLELRSQESVLRNDPMGLKAGDIYNSSGNVANKVSRGSMNTFMGLSAYGALAGNATASAMAPYAYMGSSLTGGPLRALGAVGGLGAMHANAAGTGFLGASKEALSGATNPMLASMATLPGMLGMGASKGVGGLAYMAQQGGLGELASAGKASSGLAGLLSSGSTGLAKGAGAVTEFGLENAIPGMLMGGLTMAMLRPVMSKITNKIKDSGSGQQLLKQGNSLRPNVSSASDMSSKYSKVKYLKTQLKTASMRGQVDFGTTITGFMLAAIEEHLAALNGRAENKAFDTESARVSSSTSQNVFQGQFGEYGDSRADLSQKHGYAFQTNSQTAMGETWSEFKSDVVSKMVKTAKFMEVAGNFLDFGGYLKGGESSPFAKYQAMMEEDNFNKGMEKVSSITGIPTGFLTALETSPTSLANMGETPQDKMVMLLGGLLKVEQFSAFKLQDIATALGVTEEKSFMNKISEFMDKAEAAQNGGKKKSLGRGLMEGLAKTPYAALIGGTLGLALGPMGSLAGAALGAGLSPMANIGSLLTDRYKKMRGTEVSFEDSLNSADASMLQLSETSKKEVREAKETKMFDAVIDMHRLMSTEYEGIYVRDARQKTWMDSYNEFQRDNDSGGLDATDILGGAAGIGVLAFLKKHLPKLLKGGLIGAGASLLMAGFGDDALEGMGMDAAGSERVSRMIEYSLMGSVYGIKGAAVGAVVGWVSKYTDQLIDSFIDPKESPLASTMTKALTYAVEGGLLGLGLGAGWKGAAVGAIAGLMLNTSDIIDTIIDPGDSPKTSVLMKGFTFALEGAAMGLAVGGPQGAIAGAIAGLVYGLGEGMWTAYTADASTPEEKDIKEKTHNLMRNKQNAPMIEAFEDKYSEEFNIIGQPKGEATWHPGPKGKTLQFIDRKGIIWDVKNQQVIGLSQDKKYKKDIKNHNAIINADRDGGDVAGFVAQAKARQEIQAKYNEAAGQGGNSKKEVDTPEELKLFLAAINSGQNEFAALSTGQQSSMIQHLSTIASNVGLTGTTTNSLLEELIGEMRVSTVVMPGGL